MSQNCNISISCNIPSVLSIFKYNSGEINNKFITDEVKRNGLLCTVRSLVMVRESVASARGLITRLESQNFQQCRTIVIPSLPFLEIIHNRKYIVCKIIQKEKKKRKHTWYHYREHGDSQTKFVLGIVFEFLPSTSGSRNLKDSYTAMTGIQKNLCRECKACPQILMNNASCPTYETMPFWGSSTIHTRTYTYICARTRTHTHTHTRSFYALSRELESWRRI